MAGVSVYLRMYLLTFKTWKEPDFYYFFVS